MKKLMCKIFGCVFNGNIADFTCPRCGTHHKVKWPAPPMESDEKMPPTPPTPPPPRLIKEGSFGMMVFTMALVGIAFAFIFYVLLSGMINSFMEAY